MSLSLHPGVGLLSSSCSECGSLAVDDTSELGLDQTRRIVDASGKRVKLACVNWVARLDPVVAEGLSKQPLDSISKRITSLGFNCVRLTLLRHHLPWAKAIAGVLEANSLEEPEKKVNGVLSESFLLAASGQVWRALSLLARTEIGFPE